MPYRPLYGPPASSPDAAQFQMAAWATYTPTWTNSGGAPTLGNGTIVGGYRRAGTTLHLRGQLSIGSTTTVGTGDIRMSLPSGMTASSAQYQVFSAFWSDASAATTYRGVGIGEPGQSYITFQVVDSGGRAQADGLATSDLVNWGGTIEITP